VNQLISNVNGIIVGIAINGITMDGMLIINGMVMPVMLINGMVMPVTLINGMVMPVMLINGMVMLVMLVMHQLLILNLLKLEILTSLQLPVLNSILNVMIQVTGL